MREKLAKLILFLSSIYVASSEQLAVIKLLQLHLPDAACDLLNISYSVSYILQSRNFPVKDGNVNLPVSLELGSASPSINLKKMLYFPVQLSNNSMSWDNPLSLIVPTTAYGSVLNVRLQAVGLCTNSNTLKLTQTQLETYDNNKPFSRTPKMFRSQATMGRNTFTFDVSISCNENHYGSDCSEYCTETVALMGTCKSDGSLECRSGYFGESCSNPMLTTVLASVFGVFLLVLGLSLLSYIYCKRKTTNKVLDRPEPTGSSGISLSTLPDYDRAPNSGNALPGLSFRKNQFLRFIGNKPPPAPPKTYEQDRESESESRIRIVKRESNIYDDVE